jgi:hypothetical protein
MKTELRLRSWLELADEFEALDSFMRQHSLVPMRARSNNEQEPLDAGTAVAQRMRSIASNRWTWYGWKRDAMQGEADTKLRTLHRWIAEGFFFGCDATEAGREMLERIKHIERKFNNLSQRAE